MVARAKSNQVRKDIDTLKTFNVTHISYYQLTIEPAMFYYCPSTESNLGYVLANNE